MGFFKAAFVPIFTLGAFICPQAQAASSSAILPAAGGAKGALDAGRLKPAGLVQSLNPLDALEAEKAGIAARFIALKPGEFLMGSVGEAPRGNDETQHLVKLTKGFEIQATEVTQLQYVMVMGKNPSTFSKRKHCDSGNFRIINGVSLCANHPVETLTWEDIQEFIARLNKAQNRHTYRLPTEAEREYASRGGMPSTFEHRYPTGAETAEKLDDYSWYDKNASGRTHEVAGKKPNSYGLYDMGGNVCEFTNDWYAAYSGVAEVDPTGPASSWKRLIRGGSWHRASLYLRSAYRGPGVIPGAYSPEVGFRLVRSTRLPG